MKCPFCNQETLSVSCTIKFDDYIIRYRKCLTCQNTFKTVESYDKSVLIEQYTFVSSK